MKTKCRFAIFHILNFAISQKKKKERRHFGLFHCSFVRKGTENTKKKKNSKKGHFSPFPIALSALRPSPRIFFLFSFIFEIWL